MKPGRLAWQLSGWGGGAMGTLGAAELVLLFWWLWCEELATRVIDGGWPPRG